MAEVTLAGCRPEPLSSYLKGLGLIRVLAEQADDTLVAWWEGDELHARSALDIDGIADFLCRRYRPTPLLAPWNKGSGFGEDDARTSPKATEAVERIASSVDPRLAGYREAIAKARALRQRSGWFALSKEHQVALCRNTLPDGVVRWLDATVVLTTESRAFPPLLGTGGNDGRFDFASNFMQRLAEVIGLVPRPGRATPVDDLARIALVGGSAVLDRAGIGQFDPGGAGGPGSSPTGSGESLSNPWDFILLFEGALLFASGAARRLSTGRSAFAVPFMVRSTAAGHPSAAGAENSRGELWAPIWRQPAGYPEIARFISEGRAEFAGRQAVSALDLARALATLGVDRGVTEFVRHAFVERNGLATFAVPVGRRLVHEHAGVALLGQLDGWLQRVRAVSNLPESVDRLLRAVDDAQFEQARRGEQRTLQEVLCLVAELHHLAERSRSVRERVRAPIRGLRAIDWVPGLRDISIEHELAVALASVRKRGQAYGLVRHLLTDVEWAGRPVRVGGLLSRPLTEVLAEGLRRLSIEHPPESDGEGGTRWLGSTFASPARLESIERFLAGEIDEQRLARLIGAYGLLDWRGHSAMASPLGTAIRHTPPHPLFSLVKPFFHSGSLPPPLREVVLLPESNWPHLLAIGRADQVARRAIHRLRVNRFEPTVVNAELITVGVNASRVAAACLVPATGEAVAQLLRRTAALPNISHITPAEELT